MPRSVSGAIIRNFFVDLIHFPVWWYSGGLVWLFARARDWASFGNSYLAPGLWLKNIFVPMFGQRDWQGRLASFFVRLGNVIFRGIGLLFWIWAIAMMVLVWITIPFFVMVMIIVSSTN